MMPVYKLADGRKGYRFQFYHRGKKISRSTFNGKPMLTRQDAIIGEFQTKKALEEQGAKEMGDLLLLEMYDEFVANSKSSLKESSKYEFTKLKRNYFTLIENKNIRELTTADISTWKNNIINLSINNELKNRIQNTMKQLLNYGQIMYNLDGKLQFPLLDRIKENKVIVETKKEVYLPPNDFRLLLMPLDFMASGDYYRTILLVLYNTGLRIGELASLTKQDICDGYINVNKDYIRIAGEDIIQAPKNKNSVRKIPINDDTQILLDDYIREHNIINDDDVVFHLNAPYLNQQKLRRVIDCLASDTKLNEKYEIHPHSLRHSFNTNLMNAGVDVYTRAKILGNGVNVNANTYTHTTFDSMRDAVAKLSKSDLEAKFDAFFSDLEAK